MKYVNKIMAIGLAILFLIALVIGTGIVLSVRNVNVSYEYYGENYYVDQYAETKSNLNKLKGSGILFIDGNDVLSKVSDKSVIAVDRYEKVFPCTVNVYLRQRIKRFAVQNEGSESYKVYDEKGDLIQSVATASGVPLGTDGSPLILVENLNGTSLNSVATICTYFDECFGEGESFGSVLRLVEKISVKNMTFYLRSGLSIRFYPRNSEKLVEVDKKMVKKACSFYETLSETQKLSGMIAVMYSSVSGELIANYMNY
ncbi:MAG: hypothetical protein ACI4MS_07505 [Candidatus Coproplasma sp.]